MKIMMIAPIDYYQSDAMGNRVSISRMALEITMQNEDDAHALAKKLHQAGIDKESFVVQAKERIIIAGIKEEDGLIIDEHILEGRLMRAVNFLEKDKLVSSTHAEKLVHYIEDKDGRKSFSWSMLTDKKIYPRKDVRSNKDKGASGEGQFR